jgi:hypothetical protein
MIFNNTSQGGKQMSENKQISRRNFMAIATWAIGGFIAIALTIPGIAYVIGPALKRQEEGNWIRLGYSKLTFNARPDGS